MHYLSLPTCLFALSFCLLSSLSLAQARSTLLQPHVRREYSNDVVQVDSKKHHEQFYSYISRPDIDAPRWDVKVYDEHALSEGLWFVAPYLMVGSRKHEDAFVGPFIYDGNGELVWSGADTFNNYDVFDFKVSNVGGEDMLSVIWPHGNVAAIFDSSYEKHETIPMHDFSKKTLNIHDFQMVDNGARALFLNKRLAKASRKNSRRVGYDGRCFVKFIGIEEWDLATGKKTFEWDSEDHIGLDESVMTSEGNPVSRCNGESWDYLHGNSIEKLPDGDYLLSGRRTYAVYKISHKDGSIVWRLGGKKSDFKIDGHFSGQHDARFHMQNETHMVISMMDNAEGPGRPKVTNDKSRGLLLTLNTNNMTAQVEAHYDHPHGDYAPGRGNVQTLPNGNAFVGWTTGSLQSEHTADGNLVMEAELKAGIKSYRNYKFPWVGRPKAPPDVHSAAVTVGDAVTTAIHVSWNGATEVQSWNVYESTPNGETKKMIASSARQGFETALVYEGYATFVIAEALDRDGEPLGTSTIVKTLAPSDKLDPSVLKDAEWLEDHSAENSRAGSSPWLAELGSVFSNPAVTFVSGVIFCVAVGLTIWGVYRAQRKGAFAWWPQKSTSYEPVWDAEGEADTDSDDGDGKEDEKSRIPEIVVHPGDD